MAVTRASWLKQLRSHLKREEAQLSALEMSNARRRAGGGRLSRSDASDLVSLRQAVRNRRAELARVAAGGSVVR